MYVYIQMYICMNIHVHTYTCIHTHTHTHPNTHTHTHTHQHTHTQTHMHWYLAFERLNADEKTGGLFAGAHHRVRWDLLWVLGFRV